MSQPIGFRKPIRGGFGLALVACVTSFDAGSVATLAGEKLPDCPVAGRLRRGRRSYEESASGSSRYGAR